MDEQDTDWERETEAQSEAIVLYWKERFRFARIISDENTPREEVVSAIAERLDAILEYHGCSRTLEGWRDLALWLAMDFKYDNRKVIDVVTPHPNPKMQGVQQKGGYAPKKKRPGSPGAAHKRDRDNKIAREVLLLVESGKYSSVKEAAAAIAKNNRFGWGLSSGRIENIVSERRDSIKSMPHGTLWYLSYRPMLGGQMQEAAERLTRRHEK